MLKIINLQLNDQPIINFGEENVFVYGKNGTGKTVLFKIIDYLLGHDDEGIWSIQGMDNICFLSCTIKCGEELLLFLKRTKNKQNFYKLSASEQYVQVYLEEYKNKIQEYFCGFDLELMNSYKNIVEEELSYRGIAYLNKISQYSLGDSTNIIPEASDAKHYRRFKAQTMFLFEQNIQEKINRLSEELSIIEEKIRKYENYKLRVEFAENGLKQVFDYLSLPYGKDYDIEKLKKILADYKEKIPIPDATKGEKELLYLANASASLESQINIESALKKQTSLVTNRNEKIHMILQLLKNVIGQNDKYHNYYLDIENVLTEMEKRESIISIKDFDKTIDGLKKQKIDIDNRIKRIKEKLTEKNYLDLSKKVNDADNYLSILSSQQKYDDYEELLEKRKNKQAALNELKNKTKYLSSKSLNDYITSTYMSLPNSIGFVSYDIAHDTKIIYNPTKGSLTGLSKKDGEDEYTNYIPGSKARQTCWQLSAFLGLHKYIKDRFPNFPLLPLLVVDGFNEPFDDSKNENNIKSFEQIYDYFSSKCHELGIQLIVMSATKLNNGGSMIDISNGLNKEAL